MIDVTKEIGKQLRSIFPSIHIYREQKESGFKEPAFFIAKISTNSDPATFNNELRRYSYQIVYFPVLSNLNADIDEKESELIDRFKKLDGFASVINREFQVQDKCLLMTFDVRIFTNYIEDDYKMMKLSQKGGV